MQTNQEMFPRCVFLGNGDVAWPPCSPDLSPCDYFLWKYLKHNVYKNRPHTIYKLQDSIRTTILQIPAVLSSLSDIPVFELALHSLLSIHTHIYQDNAVISEHTVQYREI
jgi:hypothetical protein